MRARRALGAVAGWALVAPSAGVAATRLTGLAESRASVAVAQGLTPFLTAPALVGLGLAAAGRRRALAVVAGASAAAHMLWLAPEMRPARPRPVDAGDGPRLRVFSANLFLVNPDMEGIGGELRATRPDVVVLQEVSFITLGGLEAAGILDDYPHRMVDPRADAFGTAVLSRFPLVDSESRLVAGLPLARTTVSVAGRRVHLYNAHPPAPMRGRASTWNAQLAELRRLVAAESGARMVVGDLNATSGHRPFRDLLSAGLRDAHVESGRWWATTWPRDRRWLPPLARLDHVLVSPELAVLDAREGTGRGSDHRPIVVDLALVG